jgi:hypothetical protein
MDGTRPRETDKQDTFLQGAETDREQGLLKNGGYLGSPPPPKQAPAAASEWQAVDGAFLLIWLNNVPFAGEYVMPAPLAKVNILLEKNTSQCTINLSQKQSKDKSHSTQVTCKFS